MATSSATVKQRYQAQASFAEEYPEWMGLAMVVVNAWGREEKTLPHAIAHALQEAYLHGEKNQYPYLPEPDKPKLLKRARPAPEPETPRATLRRRR